MCQLKATTLHVEESTFVFEEIAHSRSSRQNELGDISNNLGLVFGRQSDEPFGKSLKKMNRFIISLCNLSLASSAE